LFFKYFIYLDDLNTMIHLQPALRFNGGGHINHAIFWQVLCPKQGGNQPDGALAEQIKKDFGSFDKMVTQLSNASVGVQGSGWGWLGYNKQEQRLQIATCSNQDPLQASTGKPNISSFLKKLFSLLRSCTHIWY
jgi:Fe-Mn family superoxide dismutase